MKNTSTYYAKAQDWHEDLLSRQVRERNLYRALLIGTCGLLSLAVIGLVTLTAREKVTPFLVMMDKRTGEVTLPARINTQNIEENWNLVRYMTNLYINSRESYNFLNINEPYQTAISMSAQTVKKQLDSIIRPELNADSPIKQLGSRFYSTVEIHSISKLEQKNLLDIRLSTHVKDAGDHSVKSTQEWRIVMRYELKKATSREMLEKNPLGFTVTFYDKQPISAGESHA